MDTDFFLDTDWDLTDGYGFFGDTDLDGFDGWTRILFWTRMGRI